MILISSLIVSSVLLLSGRVDAKGTTGRVRSFNGGSFRAGKLGFFSQRYRYTSSAFAWRSGVVYQGFHVPAARLSFSTASIENDVQCDRTVVVHPAETDYVGTVSYNSTLRCFKNLYTVPNDPRNPLVTNLMLDRYVFTVNVTSYPTIAVRVFPDEDIAVPVANVTWRLRRLFLSTNATAEATVAAWDLAGVDWRPCTVGGCTDAGARAIGRPSSRFVDDERVMYSGFTGTWNRTLRITVHVWIADDFDEQLTAPRALLVPTHAKIDVEFSIVNASQYAQEFAAFEGTYLGLEILMATAATGEGSAVIPIPIAAARVPYEYNPLSMSRVQFGTYTDVANRRGLSFAWFSSTQRDTLCTNASVPACLHFLDWSNMTMAVVCNESEAAVAPCNDFLRKGEVGRALRFIAGTPMGENYAGLVQTHLGFLSPAIALTDGTPATAVIGAILAIVATTAWLG